MGAFARLTCRSSPQATCGLLTDAHPITIPRHWLRNEGSPQSHVSDASFENTRPIDKLEFPNFAVRG